MNQDLDENDFKQLNNMDLKNTWIKALKTLKTPKTFLWNDEFMPFHLFLSLENPNKGIKWAAV